MELMFGMAVLNALVAWERFIDGEPEYVLRHDLRDDYERCCYAMEQLQAAVADFIDVSITPQGPESQLRADQRSAHGSEGGSEAQIPTSRSEEG